MADQVQQLQKAVSALARQLDQMSDRTQISALSAAKHLAKHHGADWYRGTKPGLNLDECGEDDADQGLRAVQQCLRDIKGVHRLEAVFSGLVNLPHGDTGSSMKDHARLHYIDQLGRIYEKTTGKDPHHKFTTDPGTGRCWGPFLSFAKLNLDVVKPGHGLDDRALGYVIRSALPKRPDKAKPRRREPRSLSPRIEGSALD